MVRAVFPQSIWCLYIYNVYLQHFNPFNTSTMKGNMFLGYARGSVGDVTFSRTNGQQQARARNRNPNNPRTSGQMMQRSLFANSVKFHTRGVQQLFRFAFEDKATNESDYNAFMKHNMNNGIRISKQASQSPLYPAFGNWQMSCGSLKQPEVSLMEGGAKWKWSLPAMTSNVSTWGQFMAAIKKDMNLMEGDIVTFVHILARNATVNNLPSIEVPEELISTEWNIDQRLVDSADANDLPAWLNPDAGFCVIQHSSTDTDAYAQGLAIITSRKTPSGLKVSTSFLINNSVANYIIEAAQAPEFVEQILASWDTSTAAILEGSLIP